MSKNPQYDCVKPRGGGGQEPFTQCVKKHPIWQRMASLIENPPLIGLTNDLDVGV